tara:strand:+ start:476 stop:631 length:156 start_codon:yes stop_codon:yes gene_type:complete
VECPYSAKQRAGGLLSPSSDSSDRLIVAGLMTASHAAYQSTEKDIGGDDSA